MSGVLVVLEQRGGVWNRMSFEALAAPADGCNAGDDVLGGGAGS